MNVNDEEKKRVNTDLRELQPGNGVRNFIFLILLYDCCQIKQFKELFFFTFLAVLILKNNLMI